MTPEPPQHPRPGSCRLGIVGPGGLPAMEGNTLGRSDRVAAAGGRPELFRAYSLLRDDAPPS